MTARLRQLTTAYRIASCTKSFTAAAVLSLRDDGLLQLGDPITRFVPEFSGVTLPTADSPVPTIGMLLTMSAGFPTDDPWADRQEAMTDDQFTALLLRDSVSNRSREPGSPTRTCRSRCSAG